MKKEFRRISSFFTIYPVSWLPRKISPLQFWNVLTDEHHRAQQCLNQTVWRNIASWQANFQSRGFKRLVNVKWRSCSMSKQNLPYPFKLSVSLVTVIKPNAKLIQLKLNKTYVEKFENEILLRCAWTKETRSLILNAIIKCVNFLRLVRVKYQTRAFKFSMHHLHNRQRPLIAS